MQFASAVDAVRCAVDIQRHIAEQDDPTSEQHIVLRIGINLGDVVIDGDDIYGDGVNIAARLEGLAEPGGICVSNSVYEQIQGKVDIGFEDVGDQRVQEYRAPSARVPHSSG